MISKCFQKEGWKSCLKMNAFSLVHYFHISVRLKGQQGEKNSYSHRWVEKIFFFFKELLNQKLVSAEILAHGNSKTCSPDILEKTMHFQKSLVKWPWRQFEYDLHQQSSGLQFIAAPCLYQNEKHRASPVSRLETELTNWCHSCLGKLQKYLYQETT